jgi:Fe-S oxidoreductase
MLFWIGCCTTYDPLKQKVAYNVLKILQAAGIEVAVLGEDEHCCGDPARLLGDENLYQATVKSQIEMIQSRKFKYLISHCPHCLNNFKNEYPQFGANFKVVHHTEVIASLIKEGRLKLDVPIKRTITYHDPCYLGRYNDIYDEPRDIIRSIKGARLVEMKNIREKARCCGGGGGHYWMDLDYGERINVARVKEAVETGADIIAVSCIYCLQMLDDAVKILDLDEKMSVQDISELVIQAMGGIAELKQREIKEEKEEKQEIAA